MPSAANQVAVHEYASRLKLLYSSLPNAAPLSGRLPRLRMPFSGQSLELPLQCTDRPNKVCTLLKRLPAINEILQEVQAEVIEDAPGKFFVRIENGFCDPEEGAGRDGFENAAILLHCLVDRHRCVHNVQFLLTGRQRRGLELLLFDALTWTTSVTCLTLGQLCLNAEVTRATLAAICRLVPSQLRELALKSVRFCGEACASLDDWADSLATTTSLKTLKIIDVQVLVKETSRRKPADFVGATLCGLTKSSGICCVVVDASFAVHGASFARMLTSRAGPVDLVVYGHRLSYRHKAHLAFEALVTSTALKKLSMEGFDLGPKEAKALSKFLASSAVIEDIDCTKCQWDLRPRWGVEVREDRIRWHAKHLVKGLNKTKSLRRLAISNEFVACELDAVLTAARDCASLAQLHFERVTFEHADAFHDALERTGAGPKVTVRSWIANDGSMTSLAMRTWSELLSGGQKLFYRKESARHPSAGELCRAITAYGVGHLSSLKVSIPKDSIDLRIAEALAACMPSARGLQKLALSFATSPSAAGIIIGGIIQCTRIEVLKLDGLSVDEPDLKLLFGWLRDRRRTHRLKLNMKKSQKRVLETLASSLQSNYSLTSITVEGFDEHQKVKLQVLNQVRRNYGLLHSAVGFALGAESKHTAQAFELASSHPQLLEAVQRIGSLSQQEAGRKIRTARLSVKRNFWQLAGIVKEELVCHGPDDSGHNDIDGPRQLDGVGPYMLEHIRSFLKISDVLDEEPPSLPNEGMDPPSRMGGKRKRSRESVAPKGRKCRRKN